VSHCCAIGSSTMANALKRRGSVVSEDVVDFFAALAV
jgi:hypothetical protein